jgi:ATP-dependent Clp protease ATP-binding subunit ClpC
MFGKFTEAAQKVLVMAKKEMLELRHPYVGSEHLVLAILKHDNNLITKKLKEYNIDYHCFKEGLIKKVGMGSEKSTWFLYTPLLKRVIENAIINSKENNDGNVTVEHLFIGLLEEGEGIAIRIFLSLGLDIDETYKDLLNKLRGNFKYKVKNKLLVEEFGTDLTQLASQGKVDPVVGREKEIQRILEILCRRTKNNPLLVGDAGVGKTALVEELSNRIVNNNVPTVLKNKRIFSLDIASLVAGTKYRGEFEERIRNILKELEETDEIILFVDEIHTLIGAGGAEGAIDASNILKPALARNKLRCIGATTLSEYSKYIENDAAFERRFQKILIEEPTPVQLRKILFRLKDIYESYHNVIIEDNIIDKMIELSKKYIYDRKEPDKTIDLLDEVCAKVNLKETKTNKRLEKLKSEVELIVKEKNEAIIRQDFNRASELKEKEKELVDKVNKLEMKAFAKKIVKKVKIDDLIEVINMKTKIPVYELLKNDIERIKQVRNKFEDEIIGQDEVIDTLINKLKHIKFGFKEDNKPNSFIFAGATGVGKTKLATLFGESLVGIPNIIKLDMSEYAESYSTSKIIGAAPGYVGYMDNKNVLEEIRNKPHSVIIIDEIEKAHPNVIGLFLQILDEGKIKDAKGLIIRFDNTILIFTTNLGYSISSVGFNRSDNQIISILKENLGVEFINRLDNIILFNKLTEQDIEKIIKMKLQKLRAKVKKRGLTIRINNKVINNVKELSDYKNFGARRIDKIIKDKIESQIIDGIIDKKKIINIKLGDKEKIVN